MGERMSTEYEIERENRLTEAQRLQQSMFDRIRRDEELRRSDIAVLRAYESGLPLSPAWVAYRQALRDVPQQSGFPQNIVWPVKPE